MFTSIRNHFNGWRAQYQAAASWKHIIAMTVAGLVVVGIAFGIVFAVVSSVSTLKPGKIVAPSTAPKVTSSTPLDTSTADKMVTAIEAMKQEMLKQRGDLNEARTEVKGVKQKVDDIGSNLDNLQKGSDALKKRLDDVLESIKNAPKATPMSAVKPADAPQVAANESVRKIPLDKQEPAPTETPKVPTPEQIDETALAAARIPSERLPAIGRLRYARVLRDCDGVWTPAAGKERENIKGFNEMPGDEFDNFINKKCLAARTEMANQPRTQPRDYAEQRPDPRSYADPQQGAAVVAGSGGGYDYSKSFHVHLPTRYKK